MQILLLHLVGFFNWLPDRNLIEQERVSKSVILTLHLFYQTYSRVTSWLQDWSLVYIETSTIDDINRHCCETSTRLL